MSDHKDQSENAQPEPKSRAKVCADCTHRAGHHSKGWGCNIVGCGCAEQPPFPPAGTEVRDA